MTPDSLRAVADQLLRARRDGRPIPVPADATPADMAEAYAIQDAVVAESGTIGGWKVGAAGPRAEPRCAPIPSSLILQGPAHLPASRFHHLGVEAEIAFRIGADLPAKGSPYTKKELNAAIAAVMPAIELVESRWTGWPRTAKLWQLADSQSNGALIVGPSRTDWHDIDLAIQPVALTANDRVLAEAIGGNIAGDLIRLVTWLANHAARRCGGLKAGDIVTTGSCTGMSFVTAGSTVRATFPGLGEAELTLDP